MDLTPANTDRTGPFLIQVSCASWQSVYAATVVDNQIKYEHRDGPPLTLQTLRTTSPLDEWLNRLGLTLILDGDRVITNDGLLLGSAVPQLPERVVLGGEGNAAVPLRFRVYLVR